MVALRSNTSSGTSLPTTSIPATGAPEPLSLLSVLKALPDDCVRNNLVSAFGRLTDAAGCRARPPINGHQWLPGQWTPVLYGLSQDWRTYARCVLTNTLTIDLAITVSLQRPTVGHTSSGYDALDSFLAGFPSLQRLSILAGNGGAPVDDSNRSAAYGTSSSLLAIAEAVNVAIAAQQLLLLDHPGDHLRHPPSNTAAAAAAASRVTTPFGGNGTAAAAVSGGPRLTALELRLHPAVWRALRGAHPDDFLQRVVTAHPCLEELSLHIAEPAAPAGAAGTGPSLPSSPPGTLSTHGGPAVVVGLAPLATLPGLARLRLAGPIVVEGLAELTQLQALTLEGVVSGAAQEAFLAALTSLTALRLSETHYRPAPAPIAAGGTAGRGPPSDRALAQLCGLAPPCRPAPGPSPSFAGRLRSLQLPDVAIGPKDWSALARLCPTLEELELSNAVSAPPPGSHDAASSGVTGSSALAAAMTNGGAGVPDWFLRATVGDEAAYNIASGGSGGSGTLGKAGGGGEGCPFAAAFGGGGGRLSSLGPGGRAVSGAAGGPGAARIVLAGVKRLVLWEYIPPQQMVELVQLMPDLREIRACLLLDDPPDLPAAALRPAAVAILRPLVAALQPLHDVRLTVSCDPAAVTGQLACIFLMECGLAAVSGIQGLSLTVWVAAEAQLGTLAALAQLRSLELTLGKQEQESELSVLTRLERLSYLSLRIIPGIWNEIQGRTGRVSAGAALRLAMSFAAGQVLLLVADVHREICEDEAISLVKSVEMTTGQPGAAWAVSAWVEETAECIMGFGPSAGGSGTLGGGGGGGEIDGGVLRVVWTPELMRRLLGVVATGEGSSTGGLAVSFMGAEEERLGRVLGS